MPICFISLKVAVSCTFQDVLAFVIFILKSFYTNCELQNVCLWNSAIPKQILI